MIYNYGRQLIDKNDILRVKQVLQSNFLTQGKQSYLFEKSLKNYLGAKFCTVTSNGTAALNMAIAALRFKEKSKIITTPISFLASANCIVYNKCFPCFADIDKKFYTIDPNKVEDIIKKNINKKNKVRAIISVDYGGNLCDWESLFYLKNKYNLYLINDNCHALGSSYNQNKKYAMKYADITTLSFHPVKAITTGEGGAILSNNKKFDEFFKSYRSHGVIRNIKNKPTWYYQMKFLGNNYRLTDIQCALGISQLKKLDKYIINRNKIATFYNKNLTNNNLIKPVTRNNCKNSYHLYPIKINFKKLKISKKEFFETMLKKRIKLQVHYIPIHLQPYYRKYFFYKKNEFPISEKFYNDEVSIPIYPGLKEKDLIYVTSKINYTINRK